ncbi:ASCH domain-containing protein [Leptospira sp. 96542]|nr:ASCH domain-containing protein [Leptospira sp. 96542]
MLFKDEHLKGIKAGKIKICFRIWNQNKIKVGSEINTNQGIIKIKSIQIVNKDEISERDAKLAGFTSKDSLLITLKPFNKNVKGKIYKIEVAFHSEDPRIFLRNQKLNQNNEQMITSKLERLDKVSRNGHWTKKILLTIKNHPKQNASELSKITGFEKEWLKLNVRKLKNIGLTISHPAGGYEISPLGDSLIKFFLKKKDDSF